MPEAGYKDFQKVAKKLGYNLVSHKGSHQKWKKENNFVIIPIHPSKKIKGQLFYDILSQMEIDKKEFERLKKQ